MEFKYEDIAAYNLDDGIVCATCAENAEIEEVKPDDVITIDELEKRREDGLIFCCRCEEQL